MTYGSPTFSHDSRAQTTKTKLHSNAALRQLGVGTVVDDGARVGLGLLNGASGELETVSKRQLLHLTKEDGASEFTWHGHQASFEDRYELICSNKKISIF
jgi:hypothetical protein